MNRAETASFTATTDQTNLSFGESACLETPPDLYAALHEEFHFDIDLTANSENHLCTKWYGPQRNGVLVDALLEPTWVYEGQKVGYANPPYGKFVTPFLAKVALEQSRGFTSVVLLPVRINRAFKAIVLREATEIRFLDERVKFWYRGYPKLNPATHQHDPALFDSVLAVFKPRPSGRLNFGPGVSVWHWDQARRERLANG